MTGGRPRKIIQGETRQRVFDFVRERILGNTPPTTREVQEHFGFKAVQSARQHLEKLVAEGRLTKLAGKARGYGLPQSHAAAGPLRLVPMLGRVQAGALTEAIADPEGFIPLEGMVGDHQLFALTVQGDSMEKAGILPGDTVIVRRQQTARDGEIVVARIDDEATVKRLRLRGRRVELHPENDAFDPIIPEPGAEIHILGRVIEVRRKLV